MIDGKWTEIIWCVYSKVLHKVAFIDPRTHSHRVQRLALQHLEPHTPPTYNVVTGRFSSVQVEEKHMNAPSNTIKIYIFHESNMLKDGFSVKYKRDVDSFIH